MESYFKFHFEVKAFWFDAEPVTSVFTVSNEQLSEKIKSVLEKETGIKLPSRFVVELMSEWNSTFYMFLDEYGISFIMGDDGILFNGDMIPVKENTIIMYNTYYH